jgi:hypothetical protein
MVELQQGGRWLNRENLLQYALVRAPHVKTLHLACPRRRCGYFYLTRHMPAHIECVHIQAPLMPKRQDLSLVRHVKSLPEDRRAAFRFPAPGPWADRPYITMNEVDKV